MSGKCLWLHVAPAVSGSVKGDESEVCQRGEMLVTGIDTVAVFVRQGGDDGIRPRDVESAFPNLPLEADGFVPGRFRLLDVGDEGKQVGDRGLLILTGAAENLEFHDPTKAGLHFLNDILDGDAGEQVALFLEEFDPYRGVNEYHGQDFLELR